MAATWLMIAVEGPLVAAVVARLPDAKIELAAYGVAYAIALIAEAPVLMLLSASTALVDGGQAFRRLRRFTHALDLGVTVVLALALIPAVFEVWARGALGLPAEVAASAHRALLALLPWPAAIGYRRFYQGILIRSDRTHRVAVGTIVRLAAMAGAAFTGLAAGGRIPGATVGGLALTAGVVAEAVAARVMARPAVRAAREQRGGSQLDLSTIASFYVPLALTSILALAIHPMMTLFVGRSRLAIESLAVLPVVNALTFVFRSVGLSFQEVAIAQLGRTSANREPVARFATVLAAGASLGLAAVAWSPLADLWFQGVSGLPPNLAELAIAPARVMTLLPAISVWQAWQRAELVDRRRTAIASWATAIEVAATAAVLAVGIFALDAVGAVAAAWAFLLGRLAGNLSVWVAVR